MHQAVLLLQWPYLFTVDLLKGSSSVWERQSCQSGGSRLWDQAQHHQAARQGETYVVMFLGIF